MNYIDLFSGIGGFAFGAWLAGMKFDQHYYSEVDKYCVKLYKLRFPDSIYLGDITKIDWQEIKQDSEWILTGGFPCQDISIAGKGAGIHGKRSGLWFEMWRAIRILRPRFVIAENVSAITFSGLDRVLSDLAEIGYNAEWQDIRASDLGAQHKRERFWIVAYTNKMGGKIYNKPKPRRSLSWDRVAIDSQIQKTASPAILRKFDGIPGKLDKCRISGLGNSIVPQIAELLFRQIKELL